MADVKDLLEITKEPSAFKSKASRMLSLAWTTTRNIRRQLKGIEAAGQASEQEIETLEKALLAQIAVFCNINYRLHRRTKSLSFNPVCAELAKKHGLPRIDKGNLRWCEIPTDLAEAADAFSESKQSSKDILL
jgi:hypothetical protein